MTSRRFSPILLALALIASGHAQPVKMAVQFNGAPAGENVYERKSDGTFTSQTTLRIGANQITSRLSGAFEGPKLVRYEMVTEAPGQPPITIRLKDGEVTFEAGTTSRARAFPKGDFYFANYHPQLMGRWIASLDADDLRERESDTILLDSAVALKPKVAGKGRKRAGAFAARLITVTLGPTAIDVAATDEGTVLGWDVPSQKIRMVAEGAESLYVDPFAKYPELSPASYKVTIDRGVRMKTRDGVELVADVFRPDLPGKFPTVLVRTPYGRASAGIEGPAYAARGYVWVAQDCRGREESGGDWSPFFNEGRDGVDTIAWIRQQPWSDGKVGMVGASYAGYVQWAAAVERPKGLVCIIPQVSPPDGFRNLPFDHGTFMLSSSLWWAKIVADRKSDFSNATGMVPTPEKLLTLPLNRVDDELFGRDIPFFNDWLTRETARDWKGFDYPRKIRNVKIPVLHISGWFDGDGIGTKLNWDALRAAGNRNQWLVYGPWPHAFNSTTRFAGRDFGADAVIDLDTVQLRFFDTFLKGRPANWDAQPKVRVFSMGRNEWVNATDWPLPTAKPTELFLGDGKLSRTFAPAPATTLTFDPASVKLDAAELTQAMQNPSLELKLTPDRKDEVIFRSEPFEKGARIGGPIELELSIRSDAPDTDFFAMLVDIAPDGTMNIVGLPGKMRASYAQSLDRRVFLKPERTVKLKFPLWDTLFDLAPGHRLGLYVNNSMFPGFARNLGTTEPIATGTKMQTQRNRILSDPSARSVLRLHLIEK